MMKLFFSTIFGGAFVIGLILAGPVAHAELTESVTCGKITSFEADKVRMKVGSQTYVLEKAHLPPHTKVPSEVCLKADRLPASDIPETEDSKFPILSVHPAEGTKFVHVPEAEQAKIAEVARSRGIVFIGLPGVPASASDQGHSDAH